MVEKSAIKYQLLYKLRYINYDILHYGRSTLLNVMNLPFKQINVPKKQKKNWLTNVRIISTLTIKHLNARISCFHFFFYLCLIVLWFYLITVN